MVTNGVLKFWLLVLSTCSLLQTSVHSAPLQSLSLRDETYRDQHRDKYVVFNLLEQALVENKLNIYPLHATFYSESLVLCLPVVYEIECDQYSNDTWNINCTSGYKTTFMWTLFDTETTAGKFLMYFTKNRLKSPLFSVRHKFCQYSPDSCGIKLYLKVDSYPNIRGNYSVENLISSALMDITKKLKDYAYKYGPEVSAERTTMGGYSLQWDKAKETKFRSDTSKSEIYIPGVLFLIAFLVGISFGYEVLKWVSNRINRNNSGSEYYYLFWSFQFLASLINGVHIWYMHNILVLTIVIPVTAFLLYSPITVVWYMYNHSKGKVPLTKSRCSCLTSMYNEGKVPCTKLRSCLTSMYNEGKVPFTKSPFFCLSDALLWKVFVNILVVWNSFVFFVYMTYALPWIVLGFYLYPIKILVRISAIFTSAIFIIGISFVILKYLEEALSNLKQCCSNRNEKRSGYVSIESHNMKSDETQSGESVCNCISAAMKCFACVLVLVCIGFIGYLLHHIIYVLTSDVEEALVEVVHTLPLVVISLTVYIVHKLRLLGNAETNKSGSKPEEIEEFEHVTAEEPRNTEEIEEFEHLSVTAHAAGAEVTQAEVHPGAATEEAKDKAG